MAIVKCSVERPPDSRTPSLPNEALLKECLKKPELYPSPYPKGVQCKISVQEDYFVEGSETISFKAAICVFHSLHKVHIVVGRNINLSRGAVFASAEILLKATRVTICDEDPHLPVRTTVLAKKKLTIEADELIIDGADVLRPVDVLFKVRIITLRNITVNTKWIHDYMEQQVKDKKVQRLEPSENKQAVI
jgi:hypothetical protein